MRMGRLAGLRPACAHLVAASLLQSGPSIQLKTQESHKRNVRKTYELSGSVSHIVVHSQTGSALPARPVNPVIAMLLAEQRLPPLRRSVLDREPGRANHCDTGAGPRLRAEALR
jgi:hypothetical protein